MGKKKNRGNENQKQAVSSFEQQLKQLPLEMQEYYKQMMETTPQASEVERRGKFYFSQVKREKDPSDVELYEVKNQFKNEWFKNIAEKVKEAYIYDNYNEPTIKIEPIFTKSQILSVLSVGTKLLASAMNVEKVFVPGTPLKEFLTNLPKEYNKIISPDLTLKQLKSITPIELESKIPALQNDRKLIVVGDTHGTFEVLDTIFTREGFPSENTVYVFNGDYVDRGSFSIEVFISLLIFKIINPKSIYLLRGNHETESVCTNYSLKEEINRKYKDGADELFTAFLKCFKALPLAAMINDTYYVLHGGISGWKDFDSEKINDLNRFRDPESSQFMHYQAFDPLNDVLWADPTEDTEEIQFNLMRGSSIQYGEKAIRRFLKNSQLKFLIRSHQCVQNGFELMHQGHTMTLFSVPNYNGKNLAAYAVMYGVFDGDRKLSDFEKTIVEDASPYGLYKLQPTPPICFIRQFTGNDHAAIINQPIIKETMMKQWEAQMIKGGFQGIGKNIM